MGLFKKCYSCKATARRVRQMPVQLDLLEMNREREFLSGEYGSINNEMPRMYALSQASQDEASTQHATVQSCSSVDSSDECS